MHPAVGDQEYNLPRRCDIEQARAGAVVVRQTIGQWLKEAIREKLERESENVAETDS
jgi:hypothetical protein